MIEEFMSDFTNNDIQKKQEDTNEIIPAFSNSDNENKKQGRRRGAWRRVRVRPVDTFETAESQNIGRQIYNTIAVENNKKIQDFEAEKEKLNEKPYFENESSINLDTTNSPAKEEDITTTATPEIVTEIITEVPEEVQNETTSFIEEEDEVTTIPQSKSPEIEEIEEATTIASNENSTEKFDEYNFDFDLENREAKGEDSQEEPSMFDEVKKQLSDLFAMAEIDEERESMNSQNQQYTTIVRNKAPILEEVEEMETSEGETSTASTTTTTSEAPPTSSTTEISPFSKDYFGNLILATSTSTEVSHETEICYRGRCVKTEDKRRI